MYSQKSHWCLLFPKDTTISFIFDTPSSMLFTAHSIIILPTSSRYSDLREWRIKYSIDVSFENLQVQTASRWDTPPLVHRVGTQYAKGKSTHPCVAQMFYVRGLKDKVQHPCAHLSLHEMFIELARDDSAESRPKKTIRA